MSKAVEQWVEKATYDLDTAKAMLRSRRYVYVFFCCQQAVEKAIKAVYVFKKADFPPRLHSLVPLAELTEIELTAERERLFTRLSEYYIRTRYPEQTETLAKTTNRKSAQETLVQTEEVIQWLLSMLK